MTGRVANSTIAYRSSHPHQKRADCNFFIMAESLEVFHACLLFIIPTFNMLGVSRLCSAVTSVACELGRNASLRNHVSHIITKAIGIEYSVV